MPDEILRPEQVDNREPVPEGVAGEAAGEGEGYENLSFAELEKLVKGGAKEIPREEAPGVQEETQEEIPEDLKTKPVEELIKELVNLRKLYGKQANELGELRKWKEQKEREEQEREAWRIDEATKHLLQEEFLQMSEEEKEKFYEELVNDPPKAISSVMRKAMYPLLVEIAKLKQEAAINELKLKTKDSILPFEECEQEVYKIIKSYDRPEGGNELIAKYGTKAFEVAYNMYKQKYADEVYKRKLKEIEEKLRQEITESKKKQAYTESSVPTQRAGEIDYESLPFEELVKLIPGYPKHKLPRR